MRYLAGVVGIAAVMVVLIFLGAPVGTAADGAGEKIVQSLCVTCHRIEGKPESRFNLKAPDLMWAGSKYQRSWLIRWLTGKEAPLYPKGYRWDLAEVPSKHPMVTESEANAIADYFARHLKDSRVKVGAFDVTKVTAMGVEFGRQAYKAHACIGCHQIEENGRLIGGPQSTSLVESGRRYDMDWLFRFGLNPQDFVPHSGEFLADATEPQLRAVIGFLAVQGVRDFKYYEPWTSPEFQNASIERGKTLYKQYCAQCHGMTGRGDGPAASGLEPKPAVHASIPFDKLPMEYVYNVVYHGGRSVGKSASMPYWGLTIRQQGVADVIAYLKDTFKGDMQVANALPSTGDSQLGTCPQPRITATAPPEFLKMTNPLPPSAGTVQAGRTLFLQTAQPLACAQCHGEKGDGQGLMAAALVPPPRNFTCGKTMKDIPDGQLFWIIKNGSAGTGMMAFGGMPDDHAWQLIQYIRTLTK